MTDPLAEIVTLLQPDASFSKLVEGKGAWRVEQPREGSPFYCTILEGSPWLELRGAQPMALRQGDFVLVPAAYELAMSSLQPETAPRRSDTPLSVGLRHYRLGDPEGAPEVRMVVGLCRFRSADAELLLSLLPDLVVVRDDQRLAMLVRLVDDEARSSRPGRDAILSRLIESLLIEALRAAGAHGETGLLRGLGDERIAAAIRLIHGRPEASWTVAGLARQAGLSRSAFFDRFRLIMGTTPMDYLLHWRMVLAKDLLRRRQGSVAAIAQRVGYASTSTFSFAFARHVGAPPTVYARASLAG